MLCPLVLPPGAAEADRLLLKPTAWRYRRGLWEPSALPGSCDPSLLLRLSFRPCYAATTAVSRPHALGLSALVMNGGRLLSARTALELWSSNWSRILLGGMEACTFLGGITPRVLLRTVRVRLGMLLLHGLCLLVRTLFRSLTLLTGL